MKKTYTAAEMREMVNKLPDDYSFADIVSSDGDKQLFSMGCLSSMLRQAADVLERDEKRVKKYEYAPKYLSVDDKTDVISKTHYESSEQATETAVKTHNIRHVVIRREVGEWEEVK